MDNRELIIARANAMLNDVGPTAMTMDMVARSCGISKRTLYETFPDKRTLIMECIGAEHAAHHAEAKQIFAEADNCFEALFRVFERARRYDNKHTQTIIHEIIRLYPEVKERKREGERVFIDGLSQVLVQAQNEELVLDGINTHVAAFLFVTLMHSLHNSSDMEMLELTPERVCQAAFINFLRGISTGKGRQVIDDSAQKYLQEHLRS